jgi:hypothetical protein
MPYRTVLTLASIGLGLRYVFDFEASIVSRAVLAAIVLVSLVIPDRPVGQIVGILIQLGVSLFVLFRLRLKAS